MFAPGVAAAADAATPSEADAGATDAGATDAAAADAGATEEVLLAKVLFLTGYRKGTGSRAHASLRNPPCGGVHADMECEILRMRRQRGELRFAVEDVGREVWPEFAEGVAGGIAQQGVEVLFAQVADGVVRGGIVGG